MKFLFATSVRFEKIGFFIQECHLPISHSSIENQYLYVALLSQLLGTNYILKMITSVTLKKKTRLELLFKNIFLMITTHQNKSINVKFENASSNLQIVSN